MLVDSHRLAFTHTRLSLRESRLVERTFTDCVLRDESVDVSKPPSVAEPGVRPRHRPRRPPGPGLPRDALHVDPDGVDAGDLRRRVEHHPPAGQPGAAAPPPGARPVSAGAGPERRRLRRQHLQVQDGAVQAVRRVRRVQVRRQVPVRSRRCGAPQPGQAPQVQDGAVPHLPHRRVLPVRAPVSLRPQPGRGGDAAEAGDGEGEAQAGGAQPHAIARQRQSSVQPQPVAHLLHGLVLQQRTRAQLAHQRRTRRPPPGLQQAGAAAATEPAPVRRPTGPRAVAHTPCPPTTQD
jgi:hypothetical protein